MPTRKHTKTENQVTLRGVKKKRMAGEGHQAKNTVHVDNNKKKNK